MLRRLSIFISETDVRSVAAWMQVGPQKAVHLLQRELQQVEAALQVSQDRLKESTVTNYLLQEQMQVGFLGAQLVYRICSPPG